MMKRKSTSLKRKTRTNKTRTSSMTLRALLNRNNILNPSKRRTKPSKKMQRRTKPRLILLPIRKRPTECYCLIISLSDVYVYENAIKSHSSQLLS